MICFFILSPVKLLKCKEIFIFIFAVSFFWKVPPPFFCVESDHRGTARTNREKILIRIVCILPSSHSFVSTQQVVTSKNKSARAPTTLRLVTEKKKKKKIKKIKKRKKSGFSASEQKKKKRRKKKNSHHYYHPDLDQDVDHH